ncbi:MAG: DUF885 domain-containing protein [Buchananella hordeovulneris]|nr:DUF885 domain-containing protein [Buchananella hordeovulneris]
MSAKRQPTPIDAIAEDYLSALLPVSPTFATMVGLPGHDRDWDDFSPAGQQAIRDLNAATLAKLDGVEPVDDVDRVTVAAMRERLGVELDRHEAGWGFGDLNVLDSPLQSIRDVFDLMPQQSAADAEVIAQRLHGVQGALASYTEALRERAARGTLAAKRQVEKCIGQAQEAAGQASSFGALAPLAASLEGAAKEHLLAGIEAARAGYSQLAQDLQELLPAGAERDGVGEEAYALALRTFLGAKVDAREAHAWGIEELARIDAEQQRVAAQLSPGSTVAQTIEALNTDPARQLHGTKSLQEWMQQTSDAAIAALAGEHFDIPAELHRLDCKIANSGTGGIYYTPPSADFSRAGAMWWSVPPGENTFATWQEKTTVYHEGVPGHHLQLGTAVAMGDTLNSWRRLACWVSGHGEGWALYAERLMEELGFLSDPADYFGMLDGQRLRAARVVLDTGVHLGLEVDPVLERAGLMPTGVGKVWDADVAWAFLRHNVAMADSFLRFELDRYLGYPGQAPSYKLGEKLWLELRAAHEQREGAAFNLKEFHTRALRLGGVGLDVLREALQ